MELFRIEVFERLVSDRRQNAQEIWCRQIVDGMLDEWLDSTMSVRVSGWYLDHGENLSGNLF